MLSKNVHDKKCAPKLVFLYESIYAMAIEKFLSLASTWLTLTGIQFLNGPWVSGMEISP
jgi:hypothetical protein